jgi:hypothetical protein
VTRILLLLACSGNGIMDNVSQDMRAGERL